MRTASAGKRHDAIIPQVRISDKLFKESIISSAIRDYVRCMRESIRRLTDIAIASKAPTTIHAMFYWISMPRFTTPVSGVMMSTGHTLIPQSTLSLFLKYLNKYLIHSDHAYTSSLIVDTVNMPVTRPRMIATISAFSTDNNPLPALGTIPCKKHTS